MKIFCGFQNFEHILWQKHENPEPEINKKKKKNLKHNKHKYQKTAKK